MIQALIKLPRKSKKTLMVLFDSSIVIVCIFAAFSLRLDRLYYPFENYYVTLIIFSAPIIALPIFFRFGFYREVIRFLGIKSLWSIIQSVSLYAILWGLIGLMAIDQGIPRSVILINWLLVVIVVTSSRFFIRWLLSEKNIKNIFLGMNSVLIYGAGSAGRQLSTALNESKEYNPKAFIDDSSEMHHQTINGLQVYSHNDIQDLIEKNNIKEVLLAMPEISRNRRSEIIKLLEPYTVVVRSLPSVSELAQGKVKVNDLLEIDLRDLLGREQVKPNIQFLTKNILNKIIMVTGAGGSIGSELCRQIVFLKPKKLVLYDISESSLYLIEQELKNFDKHNVEVIAIIGSVVDKDRVENIFQHYGIQTIYHAAAYKHVPLVENNQSQGVLNNTIGTLAVAKAAIASNVETFVLISTDKAVRPTNIMGATKRAAELVLQALNKLPNNTCFTMVRFGNVLDSSGSVIPIFKKQIKAGGPVTVTHPDIVRYFMTIPEAVELVIQAGAMAKGGEVFILDMGEPIRIYDLAVKMIQLSGLVVLDKNNLKGDIEIIYTGLRPGEKLYEELLLGGKFTVTENKLIMCAEEEMINWDKLEPMLNEIKEASSFWETKKIYELLGKLIPEFQSEYKYSDD